MGQIKVLDCTLRDGGYCNAWHFGKENIQKIVDNLIKANVEIIECGFISDKHTYKEDCSKYDTFYRINPLLPLNRGDKLFVCMINYGEYDIKKVPICDKRTVDGIRVAFHKNDIEGALEFCCGLKEKGYKVFIQPMVSMNYTDEEFIGLIKKVNTLLPYAFYIVDTFGTMKKKDLTRLFYMVEHNLTSSILIGFHSHNNLQLSYSNAQALVAIQTKRDIIIDSSIFGMGRGAGNLNTELFLEYLNDNKEKEYKIEPLLTVIDEVLAGFYHKNYWGYSLPNYLSAIHACHPNYAAYLAEKNTLTVENINEIFQLLEKDRKNVYDKAYIEKLYLDYMQNGQANEAHLKEIQKELKNATVLLIAPGKSVIEEQEKICSFIKKENPVVISVNCDFSSFYLDYIFVGNARRYKELKKNIDRKFLVTSNIRAENFYGKVKYADLLNDFEGVKDNSSLMLIKFLSLCNVKKVYLAGLDGYSHQLEDNFADEKKIFVAKNVMLDLMNEGLNLALKEYSKNIELAFLTKEKYIKL